MNSKVTEQSLSQTVNDRNNKMIRQRADELIQRHPNKREMFQGYVKSQEAECEDLMDNITGVTWLLKVR